MRPKPLAGWLGTVQRSLTSDMEERVRRLREAGRAIVSFAEGEADEPTSAGICEAAERALAAGETRYTDVAGTPELREALAEEVTGKEGAAYARGELIVTAGAKAAIYGALRVLCEPGDEVIIPTPCWVSFPEQVRLAGARPVLVPSGDDFLLDPAAVEAALGPRSRVLVFNSPHNPTGVVYPTETVVRLVRASREYGCHVIMDQVYDGLCYEPADGSVLEHLPEARENIVFVYSFSKTYAMTGWRIGYAAGPVEVIEAMTTLQGHTTGNASSIAQAAALWAVRHYASREEDRRSHRRRRDRLVEGLNRLPGVECRLPGGAFFAFPNIRALYDRLPERFSRDSWGVGEWWLEEAGVATVPGDAFHGPDHLRLCYAVDDAVIEEGLRRLGSLLGADAACVGGRSDGGPAGGRRGGGAPSTRKRPTPDERQAER